MAEPTQFPWPASAQCLRVGDVLQLDLRYRLLQRDGEPGVELPQRVFDLLVLFLAEPHVLHTRAALFERIWQDVVVEDANLSQTVWLLRKALGPEAKDWIRTVAKSGYVFAPPVQPEPVDTAGPAAADTVTQPESPTDLAGASTPADNPGALPVAPIDGIAAGMRPRLAAIRKPAWRALAGMAAIAALAMAALWWQARQAPPPAVGPANRGIAVALVDVGDPAAGDAARWPARLLHAWLEWKLTALPEATLLTEADLSGKEIEGSPHILLLSSGPVAGRPDHVWVQSRIGGDSVPLRLSGPRADIPRMVDRLSAEVMARLLPARSADRWPALRLDLPAARRYVEGYEAYKRRDWLATIQAGRDVLERAPGFGLVRLQMAQAFSKLGQSIAAGEQVALGRKALVPLPPEADAILAAWQIGLDPQQPTEAAQAYAALAGRYPHQTGFALRQAEFLARAGDLEQARQILASPVWDLQPVATRIDRLLALSRVVGNLGHLKEARIHAEEAMALVTAAGKGWSLERGSALLLQAQLGTMARAPDSDATLYARAAEAFAEGGDEFDSLLARVLGERAHGAAQSPEQFERLLAEARTRGYHDLEIELLLGDATQQFNAGRTAEFRDRLRQALVIALDSGNIPKQQVIDTQLLNDDLLRADLRSADQRIARLQAVHLQGARLAIVGQFEANVAQVRGRYRQALGIVDGLQKAADSRGRPLPAYSVSSFDCLRGELALQQGQLESARTHWTRCGQSDYADVGWLARVGLAASHLASGDSASALPLLRQALTQLDQMPDGTGRWILAINLASLLARADVADAALSLYRQVLPGAQASGYDMILAVAKTGMAEIAASRGEWASSAALAADARRLTPPDAWIPDYRLREVEIVGALARNDHERARSLLVALDERAHALEDVQVQLEAHSLMAGNAEYGDCTPRSRALLAERSGMGGANLDWLVPAWRSTLGASKWTLQAR
jgi:DNA-binding winged helix-turn-helix (wHTH) protein